MRKNILKCIMLLLFTLICVSCEYSYNNCEMKVISEQSYCKPGYTVYTIESHNSLPGVEYFTVLAPADAFEVGDKVKIVKTEE